MQAQIDFPTGEQLKERGIQLAADKAERDQPGWTAETLKHLETYVACFGSTPFMTEDFRSWLALMDYSLPENPRSFGYIMRAAMKSGLIKSVGIKKVSNPRAHNANANVYLRA